MPEAGSGGGGGADGIAGLAPPVRDGTGWSGPAVSDCAHEPPRIDELLASDELYDACNASTLRTTMVLSYLGACGGDPAASRIRRAVTQRATRVRAGGRDSVVLSFAARLAAIEHPIGGLTTVRARWRRCGDR